MKKNLQIKSRPFEVMACQSFLLTEENHLLQNYFRQGEDIETFKYKFEE